MKTNKNWKIFLQEMQERLRTPVNFYPYPALISFLLVIVLGGHLLPDLNPRLGSKVDVIRFKTTVQHDGGIWIGIFIENEEIHLVTSDRRKFSWPVDTFSRSNLTEFIKYLRERTKKESLATAIKLETNVTKTRAVLAVDQDLKFIHIRPVLHALAAAKITRYGFETQILKNRG